MSSEDLDPSIWYIDPTRSSLYIQMDREGNIVRTALSHELPAGAVIENLPNPEAPTFWSEYRQEKKSMFLFFLKYVMPVAVVVIIIRGLNGDTF
jgi:hypothetical protein